MLGYKRIHRLSVTQQFYMLTVTDMLTRGTLEIIYDKLNKISRSGIFREIRIQIEFFWVLTPCNVVLGYQRFGEPCCLHLQDEDLDLNKTGFFISKNYAYNWITN
jgi:hypothetical protein